MKKYKVVAHIPVSDNSDKESESITKIDHILIQSGLSWQDAKELRKKNKYFVIVPEILVLDKLVEGSIM